MMRRRRQLPWMFNRWRLLDCKTVTRRNCIICSDDVYGGNQRFLRKVSIPNHGIQADFVDLTKHEDLQNAFKPNTKIWFESLSNPLLKVVDIAAVSQIAKKQNPEILVVVDNTFMGPYFQRPLSLGADVVVHSCTKYVNSHSDVVMGAAITDSDAFQQNLFFQQLDVCAVPSTFDCFLVNRGLKTFHLRMRTTRMLSLSPNTS